MRALLVVAALSAIAIARAQAAVHDDVSTALQPVRASWAANASASLDRAIQVTTHSLALPLIERSLTVCSPLLVEIVPPHYPR